MGLKIYISGKLYEKEDAKISVYDHGLLYGDGVFEGLRSYAGKVFRLDAASAPAVGFGQGHPPGNPHVGRRDGKGDLRHAGGQQARPTPTSAWSSPAGPARWGSTPTAPAIRR